jgi:signal transduction histidine kinase
VKKIIDMYGGKIWLDSKPGFGTTFFFTLPKESNGSAKRKDSSN